MRPESIAAFEAVPDILVIVNLSVDSKRLAPAFAHDRLGAGVDVHDGKTLMRQHSVIGRVNSTPVRATVA
jgi:hypothetical protein